MAGSENFAAPPRLATRVSVSAMHHARSVDRHDTMRLLRALLLSFTACCLIGSPVQADDTDTPTPAQLKMLAMLQDKVAVNPNHSDGWRSLGRLQDTLGMTDDAGQSFLKAVSLDEHNAAAHFDRGQYLSTQDPVAANHHFQRVFEIAPKSHYADQLRSQGIRAVSEPNDRNNRPEPITTDSSDDVDGSSMRLASYEIQTFDGSDDVETRKLELEKQAEDQLAKAVGQPTSPIRWYLETGLLYNDNITLTPVSRELAQSDSASFQGFASPDVDWKIVNRDAMRLGPLFRGYFTLNESAFSQFNLASFQPGVFVEHDRPVGQSDTIFRLETVYSRDLFDGSTVGDRLAGTLSATTILPSLDAYYLYLTLADSDFRDDGSLPTQTSLDGTTYTTGISRFSRTRWKRLPTYAIGVDLERADTVGDDYRYWSFNTHASMTYHWTNRWSLIPTLGLGYRSYADFTGPVSRDEFFWRLHGRLQYACSERLKIALVAGHDRFATDNDDYDTERTEGGLVMTWTN